MSYTSPTYVDDTVRRIVERYRLKKYLKGLPPKPFHKKSPIRTEKILGRPLSVRKDY